MDISSQKKDILQMWMRIWWRGHQIFIYLKIRIYTNIFFFHLKIMNSVKVDENLVAEAGEAIIFLHWEEEEAVAAVQDLLG